MSAVDIDGLSELLAEIDTALLHRQPLDFERRSAREWAAALNTLVEAGRFAAAEYCARGLQQAFPDIEYPRSICRLFDCLPPGEGLLPFTDDANQDVQLVRRDGAETLVIVFCTPPPRAAFSLPLFHRWLGLLPASVVYVRDFRRKLFLGGIQSLGADREAALAGLGEIARSVGAKRIATVGISVTGFSAMLYGLEMKADAVLALAGPTNLTPSFNTYLLSAERAKALAAAFPDAPLDLRKAYIDAGATPETLIVYGDNNWNDRIQAEYMAGLPSLNFLQLVDCQSHHVLLDLIKRRQLQSVLDWLVGRRGIEKAGEEAQAEEPAAETADAAT